MGLVNSAQITKMMPKIILFVRILVLGGLAPHTSVFARREILDEEPRLILHFCFFVATAAPPLPLLLLLCLLIFLLSHFRISSMGLHFSSHGMPRFLLMRWAWARPCRRSVRFDYSYAVEKFEAFCLSAQSLSLPIGFESSVFGHPRYPSRQLRVMRQNVNSNGNRQRSPSRSPTTNFS